MLGPVFAATQTGTEIRVSSLFFLKPLKKYFLIADVLCEVFKSKSSCTLPICIRYPIVWLPHSVGRGVGLYARVPFQINGLRLDLYLHFGFHFSPVASLSYTVWYRIYQCFRCLNPAADWNLAFKCFRFVRPRSPLPPASAPVLHINVAFPSVI